MSAKSEQELIREKIQKATLAQEKICSCNKEIFEYKIKLENLKDIKANKEFWIIEKTSDGDYAGYYSWNTFGGRVKKIKEIKMYKYRNFSHCENVNVDATKYVVQSLWDCEDFIKNGTAFLIKEGDPLWECLIDNFITKIESIINELENKIEDIKLKLKGEENESK